jgi:hypothetical protein
MTIYSHNFFSRAGAAIATLAFAAICLGSAMGPAMVNILG